MPTKKQIDEAVAEFCADVVQEPLLYFSEADLQQILTEKLRRIPELARLVDTGLERGKGSNAKYRTSLIHREYGAGESRRWDIAILDPKDVAQVERTNLDLGPQKYLPPVFAFELGTEKVANIEEHLKKDLEKVESASGHGYIIHIFRDTNRSASPGLVERKEKTRPKPQIQKFLEEYWSAPRPNQSLVAIILRTERKVQKMWGKCEVCIDPTQSTWKKVNVGDREKITMEIKKALGTK